VATGSAIGSAADELYALPLASFTAERNARAKSARGAGDRDLAARITALPKPSASASLSNRLVRSDAAALQRVLDLGSAMRAAQQTPDRDRLRELAGERRQLLDRLTAQVAASVDKRPASAVLEEFAQTLQAALASEQAAAALRTGRLVRALQANGFDPVDLTGAVAAEDEPGAGGVAARPGSGGPASARRIAKAERQSRDTEQRSVDARRAAKEADAAARAAADAAERASTDLAGLREELEALRGRLAAAERDLAAAERDSDAARERAESADRAADDANDRAAAAAAALRDLRPES
jgi:hypothetical protein